jgi:DNA helicase-2/ATP-dependent DNA helicase PcrA
MRGPHGRPQIHHHFISGKAMSDVVLDFNQAPFVQRVRDHNSLVIACPGGGKSTSLAAAIRWDIERFYLPEQIAAITFTGAGAAVLKSKVPPIGFIGTLHSFCLRSLRALGRPVSVLDSDDADDLLRKAGAHLKLKYPFDTVAETRRDWWSISQTLTPRTTTPLQRQVSYYYDALDKDNCTDYDGLLRSALIWFSNYNRTGGLPWHKIYVDEFQDSGGIDMAIYQALMYNSLSIPSPIRSFVASPFTDAPIQSHRKFCFVGDPDQSIYGFRGGRVENILSLESRGDFTPYYFFTNYRSGDAILKCADSLIKNNSARSKRPDLQSATVGHSCVQTHEDPSRSHMLFRIESILIGAKIEGVEHKDMAVLARTNAVVREVKASLKSRGIPCQSMEPVDVPKDWKFMKRVLALMCSPRSWTLAEMYLRAVGRVIQPWDLAKIKSQTPSEYLKMPEDMSPGEALNHMALMGVSRESIHVLRAYLAATPCDNLFEVQSGLRDNAVFETRGNPDGVFVGTIHGAKGREWDTVVLAAVEEDVLPLKNADLEEERRIFYVGMTRAKKSLHFCWALRRLMQYGPHSEVQETRASRFVGEALSGAK